MIIEFAEAAAREYCNAFDHYEDTRIGLGLEFREEVGGALCRIVEFPQAWPKISLHTRRCLTNRFPFGVLYQVSERRILVVGIMHMRRSPQHWAGRI